MNIRRLHHDSENIKYEEGRRKTIDVSSHIHFIFVNGDGDETENDVQNHDYIASFE